MKALELYAGLGGFAAAAGSAVEVAGALDASEHALAVYRHNFPHTAVQANLEGMSPDAFRAFGADLWWMSPPCQPYTVRGRRRDLDDPRALSFKRILDAVAAARPRCIALENVIGFGNSRARTVLLQTLNRLAYEYLERVLCPTELGIPNRRPRYYLAATTGGKLNPYKLKQVGRGLPDYLDPEPGSELYLPDAVVEKYGRAFDVVEAGNREAVATCFTSAYGRSWTLSGSYIRHGDGRVRLFSPREIARLLHFPDRFGFPEGTPLRRQWKFMGNSLNVAAVREVLHVLGLPGSAS